jgi:GT2 family glycosyltransferase
MDNQEIGFHITCGCAYSRKALDDISGFSNFFHSGAEEADITFKLIKKGYKIFFTDRVKVFHNFRPNERNQEWYRKYRRNTTRNDLLIVLMYYPRIMIIPYFFGKWISHIRFSFLASRKRMDTTFYTIVAGFEAIIKINQALIYRDALSKTEFNKWLKIRW